MGDFDAEGLMRLVREKERRMLTAGAVTFLNAVKRTLSTPAPCRIARHRTTGIPYRVATVAATPGAPPRLITGRFRASQGWAILETSDGLVGRVGTNHVAARRHELGSHPFLVPALQAEIGPVRDAMARAAQG